MAYCIGKVALMEGHELVGVVHQGRVGCALSLSGGNDARLLAQLGQPRMPHSPEASHVPKLQCKMERLDTQIVSAEAVLA